MFPKVSSLDPAVSKKARQTNALVVRGDHLSVSLSGNWGCSACLGIGLFMCMTKYRFWNPDSGEKMYSDPSF